MLRITYKTFLFFSSITLCIVLFTGFFSSVISIQKNDVTNVQWKETPAGLLVWGCAANGGIQIDLYDHNLKSIATFSKTFKDYPTKELELFYCGKS